MILANVADPYRLEAKVIAWAGTGERLESYSTRFLKVVLSGTPESESAGVYNSYVRPISDYVQIPAIALWQKTMFALERKHAKSRRVALKTKSYAKSFAGAKNS